MIYHYQSGNTLAELSVMQACNYLEGDQGSIPLPLWQKCPFIYNNVCPFI